MTVPAPPKRRVLRDLHPEPLGPLGRALTRLGEGLLGLTQGPTGDWVEILLPVITGVLATLQAFGAIRGFWWGAGTVGLVVLTPLFARLRTGSAVVRFLMRFRDTNSQFAGTLDDLLTRLIQTHDGRLGEDASHTLCGHLLRQVRDLAAEAVGVMDPRTLRATLAVPLTDPQNRVTGVRVWCYSASYAERQWTELPLGMEGAPMAYLTGSIQIIPDVRAIRGIADPDRRPYKSVVSIPVGSGPGGKALAVLNLDARQEDFFRLADIVTKLIPMIQPTVSTLALVIALRRKDEPYEFGK